MLFLKQPWIWILNRWCFKQTSHSKGCYKLCQQTPHNLKELKAEQFSQFEHDRIVVPDDLKANVLVTSLDKVYNWSRKTSMFPLFGRHAAHQMTLTAASRYDLARFGMEVMRPSPRQSDFTISPALSPKKMVLKDRASTTGIWRNRATCWNGAQQPVVVLSRKATTSSAASIPTSQLMCTYQGARPRPKRCSMVS